MFQSYFSGRYGTTDQGPRNRGLDFEIMGEVPQGSVVGPLLRNVTFDRVLKEPLNNGSKLMGFSDDTLILVSAKTVRDLGYRANNALLEVGQRINSLGLEIAINKTEAVMSTHKYKLELPELLMSGDKFPLSSEMTYLGVNVDKSLLFKSHVRKASAKAEKKIGSQLARLMPFVGGPQEDRRRLMSSVDHSVLPYGTPVWAHTLDLSPANAKIINKVQRKVLLRKTCAHRTVSEAATKVIAATPPADLLARVREVEFLRRRFVADAPPKYDIVSNWQERWDNEVSGCWTRNLIPNVTRWYIRNFGSTNFHLTQFISGHGCFGSYLN